MSRGIRSRSSWDVNRRRSWRRCPHLGTRQRRLERLGGSHRIVLPSLRVENFPKGEGDSITVDRVDGSAAVPPCGIVLARFSGWRRHRHGTVPAGGAVQPALVVNAGWPRLPDRDRACGDAIGRRISGALVCAPMIGRRHGAHGLGVRGIPAALPGAPGSPSRGRDPWPPEGRPGR